MAAQLTFFQYLSTLPNNERNLYIWLDAYKQTLKQGESLNDEKRDELYSILNDIFTPEIDKLTIRKSAQQQHSPKVDVMFNKIDADIDEKLGGWASSFSSDSWETSTDDE